MDQVLSSASNTLSRFCGALDGHNYEALDLCFIPDGVWIRQGKTLRGRAQIHDTLAQTRPASLTTIHVVTNIRIDERSGKSASGHFYLTVYRHDSGSGKREAGPFPVPLPSVVGECKFAVTEVDSRWLLQRVETGPYTFAS